jgi:hypothetical protein
MPAAAMDRTRFIQTGGLDCIDDFADALTESIEDAESNEDVQRLLSQLEDIVIEDIVRTSELQSANAAEEPGVRSRTGISYKG